MKPLDLQTLASLANGTVAARDARTVTRVVTDSRQVRPGDLFVALKGERFDAHDFLPQVTASGATACLVHKGRAVASDACVMIEVDDTLAGLQDLARGYRAMLQPLIVGLTGSNGKTSTKDFTAVVMASRLQTRATTGNLNNHIGVPLTLLSLEESDE
jgi:UDP-N-acetylmuramoyl-tripeptide--D-alanyl-D-alanine ligase